MTLFYYSNDLDKDYEIDVEFRCKSDSFSYKINGIYERDFNIGRDLSEFDLTDRLNIKSICAHALSEHIDNDIKAVKF